MKSPILDNDNSKAVSTEKELINKEQVTDSLKKAVKQAEEKATFRDYSGRIRFGESEKTTEPTTPKAFEKVIKQQRKAKQQASVIKNAKPVSAEIEPVIKPFETVGASNIVKAENAGSVIKPQQTNDIVKGDTHTVHQSTVGTHSNKRYRQAVKDKQRKAKSSSSVIKPDTVQSDNAIRELSNEGQIITNSQTSALSSTASDYITRTEVTANKPTAFEKVVHQKQMAMVKENVNKSNEPVTYRSDLTEDKVRANAEMVVTDKLPLPDDMKSPVLDKSDIDVAYAKEYKQALHRIKRGESLKDLTSDKIKGTVKSALKNSDDETLQASEKAISAATTAAYILKPESIEKAKRRTSYD